MRLVTALAVLLIIFPVRGAGAEEIAQASPQEGALYTSPTWTVSRVAGENMCDARILTEDRLFQLAALKEGAVIYIAGKEWAFTKHEAMVHIVAGEGSGFGLSALYEGHAVMSGSKTEAIRLMMEMLGDDVETLNVKDENLKVIASFPATGISQALQVWKTCAETL